MDDPVEGIVATEDLMSHVSGLKEGETLTHLFG